MAKALRSAGRFLRRAVFDLPLSIGSNYCGVFFPVVPGLITYVYMGYHSGWRAMNYDLVIGFMITLGSYAFLLAYVIVRNLYREHVAMSEKIKHFSPFQLQGFELARELRELVEEIGEIPALQIAYPQTTQEEIANFLAERHLVEWPWRRRLSSAFERRFSDRIKKYRLQAAEFDDTIGTDVRQPQNGDDVMAQAFDIEAIAIRRNYKFHIVRSLGGEPETRISRRPRSPEEI